MELKYGNRHPFTDLIKTWLTESFRGLETLHCYSILEMFFSAA